jgi:predicted TPR repeat methyltransferase
MSQTATAAPATDKKPNYAAEIGRQIGLARAAQRDGDEAGTKNFAEAALSALKNVELNYENLDWRQLAEGDTHWLLGNMAGAEKAFRQAMVAAPQQNGGYRRLAELFQAMGRTEDLNKHLDLCLKRFPKEALFLKISAVQAAANQNYDVAIPALAKAFAADPQDAETADALGSCLQNINHFNEAVLYHHRAMELEPKNAGYVIRFGLAMANTTGGEEAAMELFRMALNLNPNLFDAYAFLGREYARVGRTEDARAVFQAGLALAPDNAVLNFFYGQFLQSAGQPKEAAAALDKSIAASEDENMKPAAQFIRAAAMGETPERAPNEFVRNIFDYFSANFEKALKENPQYRSPGTLLALLEQPAVTAVRDIKKQKSRVLDLGCGTGLMGVAIKPYSDALVGVDLSISMLQRANEKGIYSLTRCQDIQSYLDEMPAGSSDLVTAADVFSYIGKLNDIFTAFAQKLSAGALVAFGCEALPESVQGPGYALRDTVRYAHKDSYIRDLAAANGFNILAHQASPIRQFTGEPVDGLFYVLAKK